MTPEHHLTPEEVRKEVQLLQEKHGFVRPSRSTIDPSRPWKSGPPNYDMADLLYFRGKTMNHEPNSLESVVENAVKNWEMEATHLDFEHWNSVDHSSYRVSANGAKTYVGEEGARAGNYNWLLAGVDKNLYDNELETFHSSHELFRGAFLGGFPWEVLQVFSAPPRVSFSWRHWATFHVDGDFKGRRGDDKKYEMYGFGVLELTEDLKIRSIEIYYKPEEFMKALHGEIVPACLEKGQSLVGSGCPFLEREIAEGGN
ncbi:NTF2-like protein [Gracilaria domingensis]|nr:NTF2-like protein [Gracilaria domingensis]